MQYNATEAERTYGTLQAGITAFVMNSLEHAERTINELVAALEKSKKEVEVLKIDLDSYKQRFDPPKVK